MQVFYVLFMALVSTFFIYRRRVDLFLLWFLAVFAISPPYFFGFIFIPPLINVPEGVEDESYLLMTLNVSIVLISAALFDKTKVNAPVSHCSDIRLKRLSDFSYFLALISLTLLIIVLIFVGADVLSNHRSGVSLSALESGLVSKTILFATYSILFGFFSKNSLSTIVGFSTLISMFVISPSRSFIFISFLSILMVFFIPKRRVKFSYLIKFSPVFIFILSFVIFGKVYRQEGESLMQITQDYINSIFDGGRVVFREANYIAANLQVSIESFKPGELIERLLYYPLMLVPFLYLFFIQVVGLPPLTRFSEMITDAHDFDRFGIASSLWGEFYGVGGWLAILLFALIFSSIVFKVNSRFYKGNVGAFSLAMLIPSVYLVAYSHRLDFALVLNRFSEAILVYIFYLGFSELRKL